MFHSFGQFSVGTGDIANFTNETALATENILSRVTGGSPSEIFGTLQTTGFPGADLYLLNPSGVLFGPTASLNVEGGFHLSTADFIRLSDGVRFDAMSSPNDALLTTAPPEAFGFLGENPVGLLFRRVCWRCRMGRPYPSWVAVSRL
ncbi:MAG: filamentous hemagglutinin N-terminal domain-containing protein [Gammaproteobacteria bacterium]